MIPRFRLLAERIRNELSTLDQVVARAEGALSRTAGQQEDSVYFISAAALDLHGFYAGLERLFELITGDVDESRPTGSQWHRNLLAQMALAIPDLRPPVISNETRDALQEYLEFRHVVRNVYTFNLREERVIELVRGLRRSYDLVRRDLLAFAQFLDELSTADED